MSNIKLHPYITYLYNTDINFTFYPYVSYIDHEFDNRTKKTIYYLYFYSDFMQKEIKCLLYDTVEGFPIKNVHLSVGCSDGKVRYCPLNHLDSDFDSGIKVEDKYGNQFQICTARQENILNKYMPYSNWLIPLTTPQNLYLTLRAVFGSARVSIDGDDVYFSPPPATSGITKMFVIGLNTSITTNKNITYNTNKNGLITTSYGGDNHGDNNLFSKSMLLKIKEHKKLKINFSDTLRNIQYPSTANVKNAIVFGTTVENLDEKSSSYNGLISSTKWFIYNKDTNYMTAVTNSNKELSYFKNTYLNYPKSKFNYNYYDLSDIEFTLIE